MTSLATALVITLVAATVHAQPAEVSPSFEVASIRRTELLDGVGLITWAYNVPLPDLVAGLPEWVRTERYDVNAKAADPATSIPQQRLMMQALLRERFNLQVTRKQEIRPVYELVLARADGRLGPKLKNVAIDCDV